MHWLAHFPVGLFAIPVGMFGLSGAWLRASIHLWPPLTPFAHTLLWLSLAIWAGVLALYLVKCLHQPQAVKAEFSHPVHGALFALLPLSILLAVMLLGGQGESWSLPTVLITIAMHGVIAVRVIAIVATARVSAASLTPALYLPIVGGGFISGMAMAVLGHQHLAAILFGMGLAGWMLLEARLFSRLFDAPLPSPWRLTIGIELSPPTVAPLAAIVIWPAMPVDVLLVGLGMIVVPVIAILVRQRWWLHERFSIGFWSFSFPAAAVAAGVVEAARRGGLPTELAGACLFLATALIGYLLLRTLPLLRRQHSRV